jgi:hypothetical protein
MTVLGVNMTTKDPTYGWADIKPTIHARDPFFDLAERMYRRASELVDEGADQIEIDSVNDLAKELEDIARDHHAECECRPDSDLLCRTCKAMAQAMNLEY